MKKVTNLLVVLAVLGAGVAKGQNTNSSSGSTTQDAATPTNSAYTTTTTTTTDRSSDTNDRTDGKEGKFGVYAGVNFSQFVNEVKPAKAYRPGYQVGVYYRSPGTIFGQIGVEYRASSSNLISTASGSGTTTGSVTTELTRNIDQRFLAIPAYVGTRIGGDLGLRLQIGAELASLVGVSKNDFNLGSDDLKRTILNGLAGVGVNLGPVTLDLVYNHGFVQVFDKTSDTKRNILSANVGLRF
jgi:hypothetical protein